LDYCILFGQVTHSDAQTKKVFLHYYLDQAAAQRRAAVSLGHAPRRVLAACTVDPWRALAMRPGERWLRPPPGEPLAARPGRPGEPLAARPGRPGEPLAARLVRPGEAMPRALVSVGCVPRPTSPW